MIQMDNSYVEAFYKDYILREEKAGIVLVRKYDRTEYLEEEIWAPVPYSNDKLYASSFGRLIRGLGTSKEKLVTPSAEKGLKFKLNGKPKRLYYIVAAEFWAAGKGGIKVRHLNADRDDNKIDNLVYCSSKTVHSCTKIARDKTKNLPRPVLFFLLTGITDSSTLFHFSCSIILLNQKWKRPSLQIFLP